MHFIIGNVTYPEISSMRLILLIVAINAVIILAYYNATLNSLLLAQKVTSPFDSYSAFYYNTDLVAIYLSGTFIDEILQVRFLNDCFNLIIFILNDLFVRMAIQSCKKSSKKDLKHLKPSKN